MPPRKRSRDDADGHTSLGSPPKKHRLRSSTRLQEQRQQRASVEEDAKAKGVSKGKSTKSATLKTKKAIAKAPPQSTKASSNVPPPKKNKLTSTSPSTVEVNDNENDASTSIHPEPLTIESPLLKSPLHCELWHGQRPVTTTSASSTNDNPEPPPLIFTHGAGGTLSAPAVVSFCKAFSSPSPSISNPILAFQGTMNLPSRTKGFHACIAHLSQPSKPSDDEDAVNKSRNLLLGGRSMGSRAAAIAATEYLSASPSASLDLLLVSYPLVGPKPPIRSAPLLALPAGVAVLFVVGDRDGMCPLPALHTVRKEMKARSWVVVVRGADHGMAGRKGALAEEGGRAAGEWVRGRRWDEGEVREVG
ncbi:hypothetical protein BU24DRAFT_494647 [Aaosphaeria arxii CBS 175.79]|uniref:KANL3/Tex30 alpha/beta hydrolase-like domain-containing protein n=1 Tax=Aaosphaeria arxii CBS 175.79 TaxID=1450172 RepID=A0A6A5XIJ9_9PLEO|nr:uncharacterized protein BU24DRAFT_494647 [Aaosphaeria arxii CBS 175.79]KAF2012686.1 hypothetical protein BU24DRAFT_494647 [Aaosphaeria arxii CBS 175.79]